MADTERDCSPCLCVLFLLPILLSVMQLWYSANFSWGGSLPVHRMNLMDSVIVREMRGIRQISLGAIVYLVVV